MAQDGRGRGNPLSNPLRPGSPSGVYRYGGAHGGKKSRKNEGRYREEGAWEVRVMSERAWRAGGVESWRSQTLRGAWRRRGLWGRREA